MEENGMEQWQGFQPAVVISSVSPGKCKERQNIRKK